MQSSSVLPATALCLVQRWDTDTGEIENGTYFGLIAALTFKGPFEISGVRVSDLPHDTLLRVAHHGSHNPENMSLIHSSRLRYFGSRAIVCDD